MECWSLALHLSTWAQFFTLFLYQYSPRILRDPTKDEFLDLEQGNIFVATYETKFYALSRYATQLIGIKEFNCL